MVKFPVLCSSPGREKPLALYIFSKDEDLQQIFLKQVSSGGVTINDVIFHLASKRRDCRIARHSYLLN